MFTSDGKFLYSFGSRGEGNGQFNGPTGLAVDNLDNIVVADWGNSRLQVHCSASKSCIRRFVITEKARFHI